MSIPDLSQLKNDFPMLAKTMHGKPLVYLDSAATAQKPKVVIEAINDFYANSYGTVHRAVYELAAHSTQEYQAIRKKIAAFLNAASDKEIIYTRGTTESINMVAYSFGKAFIQPGDEILISEMEHHSNIVPWQLMCEDRGAILKVIPMDDRGQLKLDAYKKMLNKKTKMVAITQVSNVLGTVNPVKEMSALAHEFGAKVLIDGAQSAPHFKIDVQDMDCDFFVFSGHKNYGPTGIGILYGKEELLNAMPPYQGGGDMIESVTFPKTTYNVLPLKFEAGTPMIAEVMGLGAAIDYLSQIGLERIHHWEHHLLTYATEKLMAIPGLRMIGTAENKGAIAAFVVEDLHALDIGTFLDLRGIAVRTGHNCAQPTMKHFGITATVRASFAFYNQPTDIDRFVDSLKEVIEVLKG